MKSKKFSFDPYFYVSVFILIISAFIVFMHHSAFYTIDSDLSYHIATTQSFVTQGGIGLIEAWGSLPTGRPHLYPPVVHLLLTPLVIWQLDAVEIFKIFNAVSIFGLLILSWFAVSKLFNYKVAAIYLLTILSYSIIIRMTGNIIPSAMVLFLSPYLIILIKKNKIVASTLLLTLFFYTHMIFPWFIVGALAVWAFFNRKYLLISWRTVLFAVILYFPWLLHISSNLEYLRYFGPRYRTIIYTTITYSLNITLFVLFILSIVVLGYYWKRKYAEKIINKDIIFFVALPIVALPIAYFEFSRYAYQIGIWPMTIVIAYVVANFRTLISAKTLHSLGKWQNLIVPIFFIITLYSVQLTLKDSTTKLSMRPHLFIEALPISGQYYLNNIYGRHFTILNYTLAERIKDKTESDGIILNLAHKLGTEEYPTHRRYILPQFFAALANRKMANPRSPEYNWHEGIRVQQANILIVNADQLDVDENIIVTDDLKPYLASEDKVNKVINLENFTVLNKTGDGLIVLKNDVPVFLLSPSPQVVLPLWISLLILYTTIIYIWYSVAKKNILETK